MAILRGLGRSSTYRIESVLAYASDLLRSPFLSTMPEKEPEYVCIQKTVADTPEVLYTTLTE